MILFHLFRSARTAPNIELVKNLCAADAEKPRADATRNSARRNDANLSKSSFNRITKEELKLHCFKPSVEHEIKDGDAPVREQCCHDFLGLSDADRDNFCWSDEANFNLDGSVNKQNNRAYSPKKKNGVGGKPDNFRYHINS